MAALTRETIDAEHYVARYARGALNEEEAERFEEFCLLHPGLVQDVHVDREMRRALRAIDARDRGKGRRMEWRPLALAASVLLVAVIIGWPFWHSGSSAGALFADSKALPAALREHRVGPFALARERGAVQSLQFAAGATSLGVEVELPADAGTIRYRLTLEEWSEDGWVPRGQIEPSLGLANDGHVVPVVIDLREVHGPRLRLVCSGPNGFADAFEFRLDPR
jgi:hypothetical protein